MAPWGDEQDFSSQLSGDELTTLLLKTLLAPKPGADDTRPVTTLW